MNNIFREIVPQKCGFIFLKYSRLAQPVVFFLNTYSNLAMDWALINTYKGAFFLAYYLTINNTNKNWSDVDPTI